MSCEPCMVCVAFSLLCMFLHLFVRSFLAEKISQCSEAFRSYSVRFQFYWVVGLMMSGLLCWGALADPRSVPPTHLEGASTRTFAQSNCQRPSLREKHAAHAHRFKIALVHCPLLKQCLVAVLGGMVQMFLADVVVPTKACWASVVERLAARASCSTVCCLRSLSRFAGPTTIKFEKSRQCWK